MGQNLVQRGTSIKNKMKAITLIKKYKLCVLKVIHFVLHDTYHPMIAKIGLLVNVTTPRAINTREISWLICIFYK